MSMIGEIIDLISIAQYWYLSMLRYFVSVIVLLRIYLMTDKGGSKKNNIHLLVNGVKYYYKNSKFISKAGKEIPKKLRNNSTINDALAKALYLIKNGW